MSNRRRRDGQPTTEEQQRTCVHAVSGDNPTLCITCGATIDPPPGDDSVDDLASLLPPSDGTPPIADAVAERQAEAAADSAPAVGGGEAPSTPNHLTYFQVKDLLAEIAELEDEISTLRGRVANKWKEIEKGGRNRKVVKRIASTRKQTEATVEAEHREYLDLYDALVKPRIAAARAGETDE